MISFKYITYIDTDCMAEGEDSKYDDINMFYGPMDLSIRKEKSIKHTQEVVNRFIELNKFLKEQENEH